MLLTLEQNYYVSEVYRKDFDEIQGKFVRLFVESTKLIKESDHVSAEELKEFLAQYPDLEESLVNTTTISDMVRVIKQHSSFTCCSYLEHVADQLELPALTEKIENYKRYVIEFCSQTLTKHIYMKPFITNNSIDFTPATSITFKLEWSPSKKTLADIQSILRQAFHEHQIYVHIVVVRGGSVRVLCVAPQHVMKHLVRLAQVNQEVLVESGVTYLRVGDTIVVDKSGQNEVR